VWGKIGQLFSGPSPQLDEIEEILYTADIPTILVQELLEKLEKEGKGKSSEEIQNVVFKFLKEIVTLLEDEGINYATMKFDDEVSVIFHDSLKKFGMDVLSYIDQDFLFVLIKLVS
jgi:hypothetical protein